MRSFSEKLLIIPDINVVTDVIFNVQFHIVTRCSPTGGLSTTQQISYQLFTDSKMSTVSHHYQLTYVAIV